MPPDPRLAAVQLLYRYAELIDGGDFEGLADLLARAELTFEGQDLVVRGRSQVLALYTATTRRHDDGTPRTKHVVTNPIAELAPGGAAVGVRSYFTVLQQVPGVLALQPVIAGRYRHRIERGPEGDWHIAAMHVIVELTGELGHHLLISL